MNKAKNVELELYMHWETEKAMLFSLDGEKKHAVWIPKTISGYEVQVDASDRLDDVYLVTLPEFVATEKGLI